MSISCIRGDLVSNIAQAGCSEPPGRSRRRRGRLLALAALPAALSNPYPRFGGWRLTHVRPLWLDDIESLEAISQNEDARRIFLRMAALSQTGPTQNFVVEGALDGDLDAVSSCRLVELAQDESFLLTVDED